MDYCEEGTGGFVVTMVASLPSKIFAIIESHQGSVALKTMSGTTMMFLLFVVLVEMEISGALFTK